MTDPTNRRPVMDSDVRCPCGRLIARRDPRGIVLKCPRCKKEAVVPLNALLEGNFLEIEFVE